MRKRALALSALLLALACQDGRLTAPTAEAPSASAASQVAGRFIVTLREGVRPGDVARDHGIQPDFEYTQVLNGFAGSISDAARDGLFRDARVTRVEPDGIASIDGTQSNATWGLDRIDQRPLPLDGTYGWGSDGSGVTAFIIDTGIRITHSEFGGRAAYGKDFVDNDDVSDDCDGHGTHVAGTVGGATYGVAKAVQLIAVRVLDCSGSGTWSGVIAGMDWVAGHHSAPAVANMSLGGGASASVDDALRGMIASGVATAVAAGNNGTDAGKSPQGNACAYSPARVAEAMTVGATDRTDRRASFSNYGTCLDWFAPGVGISSAWNTSNTATNTISGTSMATPHTTGVAALYLRMNPGASPAQVQSALYDLTTKGIVTNAASANNHMLFSAAPAAPPANQPPVASFTSSCTDLACGFDASGSSDPGGSIVSYAWSFGDGGAGVGANASHTYAAAGTFTVTLTVTDNEGATNTATGTVTPSSTPTNPAPVASFTSSCTDLACSFDASGSSDPGGSIVSYAWSFGDGGTDSGVTASRTYAAAGTFTVTLTVTDNEGATNTATGTVTPSSTPTNPAPVASFTASCTDLVCSFDASGSSDPGGSIASYAWSFGDGGTDAGVTASRTYAAAGTYTVSLTVTDNEGATNTATGTVTPSSPPPPSAAVYVSAITFSTRVLGKVNTELTVTVTVRQTNGSPGASDPLVSGATVAGTLSRQQGGSWTFSGTTGTSGQVSWKLMKAPSGDYTASVTNVGAAGGTWEPSFGVTSGSYTLP